MNFIGNWMTHIMEELPHLLELSKPVVFYENEYFRITSVLTTTWLAMLLIIGFVLFITSRLEKKPTSRRQAVAEKIVLFFYGFVEEVLGHKAKKYYSILGSLFIIILVMNLIWLIPTLAAPTISFSTTAALAIIGYGYTQLVIIGATSPFKYLANFAKPNPLMLIGHVIEVFSKPLSLSMRMFGNLFSGRILDTIVLIALPIAVPIVFNVLGILVGAIQAYVFTLLLTMYISEGLEHE